MPEEQGRVPGETAMRCQEMAAGTGGLGQAIVQAILTTGAAAIGKLGANSGVDIGDVTINNIASNPVLSAPFSAMLEGGLTQIVTDSEQIDQDEYSESAAVALGATVSGEVLSVLLATFKTGSGAILTPAGTLLILDATPTVAVGDTYFTGRATVIGQIDVAAADWQSDGAGGSVFKTGTPIPFHALATLHFLWFHSDATSFNDAAGDDETMYLNFWYRRDS